MTEPVSISSGIAQRYATAVFELARDDGALAALDTDVAALDAALTSSADLRAMIASPLLTRQEQAGAVAALAGRMGLSQTMRNTLALMAAKRRLFVLPQLVAALAAMLAEEKGEVTAEVTAARPLSEAQSARLAETLKASAGREVRINLAVDESLIGGLVVKLGSKMIDSSIRSKLANLQNAMKEVR